MLRTKLFIAVMLISITGFAQRLTPEEYIEQYKEIAVREMKRMGVPAAITLAQGILESESGNSELVKKSNNHFGIKCKSNWTSGGVTHDDDEKGECFRKYNSAEDSYRDHSNFLRSGSRYAFLFQLPADDYKAWATGLKKAGYATNPKYPEILIRNIEKYNLQQYSLLAINDVPKFDAAKYQDDKENKTPQVSVVAEGELNPPPPAEVAALQVEGSKDEPVEAVSTLDRPDKVVTINGSKAIFASKGSSLLVIATKNNVNLNRILEFNELAEDGVLGKDQYVYLQKKSKQGAADYYILKEGESLYDAAQKNGIQLQYLIDYNRLKNDDRPSAGTKLSLKPAVQKQRTRSRS